MESLLDKFEKDRVNVSQIYAGNVCTGRMLYGTSGNMTLSGTEYASFDKNCAYLSFVSDTGGTFYLDPVC